MNTALKFSIPEKNVGNFLNNLASQYVIYAVPKVNESINIRIQSQFPS